MTSGPPRMMGSIWGTISAVHWDVPPLSVIVSCNFLLKFDLSSILLCLIHTHSGGGVIYYIFEVILCHTLYLTMVVL